MDMDTLYGTPFAPFGPRWSAGRSGGRSGQGPVADPNMRVSDAERAEVADQLSKHYGDGRLDEAEFNERLGKAMGAKTRGDLAGLLDDLPRPQAPAAPVPKRPIGSRVLGLALAMFLLLSIASAAWTWHWHLPILLIVMVVLLAIRRRHRHLHRWHGGHGDHTHFGQAA